MNTYFLDDDIFFTLNVDASEDLTGEYTVYAYIKDRYNEGDGHNGGWGDGIFYGTVFMKAGQKQLNIYLNDILENNKKVDNSIVAVNNELIDKGVTNTANNFNRYRVYLVMRRSDGSVAHTQDSYFDVYLAYRYPNLKDNLGIKGAISFDSVNDNVYLLRDGYDANTGESLLLPRVTDGMRAYFYLLPTYDYLLRNGGKINIKDGTNIKAIQTERYEPLYDSYKPEYYSSDYLTVNGSEMLYKGAVLTDTIMQEQEADNYLFHTGLWNADEITEKIAALKRGEETVVFYADVTDEAALAQAARDASISFGDSWRDDMYLPFAKDIKIAKVDKCPSKYYVMWYDRLGGVQCQPFNLEKQNTFSEGLEHRLNKDQYNRNRVLMPTVTPKWKLSTEAITDENYPIYESILVSPYVTLFDTDTNKAYNVIVTDSSYMEKSYRKNGNNPINFTITVELNKKQNILY